MTQLQSEWNQKCAHQHFGLWAVEPDTLEKMVSAFNAGHLVLEAANGKEDAEVGDFVIRDGIAYGSIRGTITKYRSSFGGTSSLGLRADLRELQDDPAVKGAFIKADTPGGTVSGTHEATQAMAAFAKKKPLHVHVSDLMASAGLWIGSQATRITANQKNAFIGSLGVITELIETAEMEKQVGIKRHVLATGPMKSHLNEEGKVSDQAKDDLMMKLNAILDQFASAVAKGRNLAKSDVMEMATGSEGGKTYLASEAMKLGLIDAIENEETALKNLMSEVKKYDMQKQSERDNRRNRIKNRK